MGSITRRGSKSQPRFFANYSEADGARRRMKLLRGARNLDEARTLLAAIELRIAKKQVGIDEPTDEDRARRTITVRELAARFLGDVEGEPGYAPPKIKSVDNYRRDARTVLKSRVLPALGDRAAASVAPADVERFRDALYSGRQRNVAAGRKSRRAPGEGLSASSVTQSLAVLSKIYNWARRVGLVDCANPVQGVERPRGVATVDYLERDEVARLLATTEAIADRVGVASWDSIVLAPMVAAAAFTGMRKGELLGLRWRDVHLDAGRIDVMRSYDLLPKSGKPRHVPIHPTLARVLREWKKVCPATEEGFVFPVEAEPGRLRMGVKLDTLGLGGAFELAGCHTPADGKWWHMLRHTFASHAVMSGTSLYEVQRLLGHSTAVMTMRYAHLAPDHLAGAVARLDFSESLAADVASMDDERRRRA